MKLKIDADKAVKVVGIVGSCLGVVATLASNWASEKKTDAEISKKVAEAIAKAKSEES